jgi:hypothetical protein
MRYNVAGIYELAVTLTATCTTTFLKLQFNTSNYADWKIVHALALIVHFLRAFVIASLHRL